MKTKTSRKPLKKFMLDVSMTIAPTSNSQEDRHKMTEPQIGISLHRRCPHITATTGISRVNSLSMERKVTAIAAVKASSSDRALDIVSDEITHALGLDYDVISTRVTVRK